MKYRKIKKNLTKLEALEIKQKVQNEIETCYEFLATIDNLNNGIISVVLVAEYGNIENAKMHHLKKIQWCKKRLEDLKQYT